MHEKKIRPHRRAAVSAVTLSIVASAAIGFGATSAWAAGNAGPEAYLQILSEPGAPKDQLPPRGHGGQYFEGTGLRYETSRYLGAIPAAKFWVAVNDRGHICLINILTATGGSSMSCVTTDRFGKSGVSSSVTSIGETGEEGYVEAYLVPDSLRFTGIPPGLTPIANNVVAGDSRGQKDSLTASTLDGRAQLEILLVRAE